MSSEIGFNMGSPSYAKARKKDLCDKYGPNGTTQQHMTQQIIDAARNEAKKIYKGCKC